VIFFPFFKQEMSVANVLDGRERYPRAGGHPGMAEAQAVAQPHTGPATAGGCMLTFLSN
jgi:hypothetical protein